MYRGQNKLIIRYNTIIIMISNIMFVTIRSAKKMF